MHEDATMYESLQSNEWKFEHKMVKMVGIQSWNFLKVSDGRKIYCGTGGC